LPALARAWRQRIEKAFGRLRGPASPSFTVDTLIND
jgi:hypothetical protein